MQVSLTQSQSDLPAIELVEDNYGNVWRKTKNAHNYILTELTLKPGDILTVKVSTSKTLSADLYFGFQLGYGNERYNTKECYHSFEITKAHISRSIALYIRLTQKYGNKYLFWEEDDIQIRYRVE